MRRPKATPVVVAFFAITTLFLSALVLTRNQGEFYFRQNAPRESGHRETPFNVSLKSLAGPTQASYVHLDTGQQQKIFHENPKQDVTTIVHIHFPREVRNETCREVRKVAFLKIHKVGSTTVMNIVQRFGHIRNLIFALPKDGNYLGVGTTIRFGSLLPPPKGQKYDLIINHVVYSRQSFSKILPRNESFYLAILREPLDHLVSTVEYLKDSTWVGYLLKLPRRDPLGAFLADPKAHEAQDYRMSFTNNRMSFDLGMDGTRYHNETAVDNFIAEVDKDFGLVMILEHFDESLVLMKRYLCWSVKDILYVPRNVNTKRTSYNITTEQKQRYKEWAFSDYKLYDFFYERLQKRVDAEGPRFFQEVKVFKETLSTVREFCSSQSRSGELIIPWTEWNDQFTVSRTDCMFMLLAEMPFIKLTRAQQLKNLGEMKMSLE